MLQRLGIDDQLPFMPLLFGRCGLKLRKRNAQRLVHIDPIAEQIGSQALDHTGYFDGLTASLE